MHVVSTAGLMPQTRVGISFIASFVIAFFTMWMAILTPVVVAFALRVEQIDPANKETNLAFILGIGAIVALIANPVAGYFSDRTTSVFGMRKPWMLGGFAVAAIGTWLIVTGGLTSITAVLPDQVPEEQRGVVSGLLGMCIQGGILAGIYVAQFSGGDVVKMFTWPMFACAGGLLLFMLTLKDRRLAKEDAAPIDLVRFAKDFWINPKTAPDFSWAFVSRFLLFIGLATLISYQVYYLIDVLGIAPAEIPTYLFKATLALTIATVVSSALAGWASDLFGRRKIFVLISAVIYGAGLIVIGLATDFNQFVIGATICGIGQGVYVAVDLALVAAVLPNKGANAAKDLGIFNIANALPQSIAPAIAPIFLGLGAVADGKNYTALFIAAGVFAIIGALAIIPIRTVR
ncbi:MFS transporter [Roseinatronobacter alkalisoli]|uniref:MFS transporter n=1 Tax=Roseinatronobacter alkalisoli TaxID=3028235 RepID=A0ABT5TCX6_9RHOB|nr:MFS transporter [Roseinatronobacter sp. HJB301]MDD7972954.1 MFS transporter [Roseinatronobacter sp. HJB301]